MTKSARPNMLEQQGKGDLHRWLSLVVLCTGQLMIILDQTIVNVALPSIQGDLGFSQSGLAWVVNVYLIAFGGLLLLFGRLGDLLGRKRIFVAGLVVFTLASLLCGLAQGQGMLILARFVQGIGGAMASSVVLGMIFSTFPEPRELAKAIGFFSFVAAAGGALGPLVGGALTQAISWHWIFFVNVPLGVMAIVLAARLLKPERGLGLGKGVDVPGAFLVTSGLMLTVYTIVGTTDYGWASVHTLGFSILSGVMLAGFVARQTSAAVPILPLRVLRSRRLSGANLVQALMVVGMFGFLFLGTLYVRRVLGYDPMTTGLAFLPVAVVIGMVSLFFSAPLNTRFGERRVLVSGLCLIVAGLALLARAPVDGDYALNILPVMLLLGVGFGAGMPALTALAMSGAAPEDSGFASGLFNTTQQVGGALGLAILATLATSRTEYLLADGRNAASALTGGYNLAFAVGAGFVVAGLALAVVFLGFEGVRTDEERA